MRDILPPKGMCSASRDILKFWKINDNISLMVQDREFKRQLQWKTSRKSYVAYRMAPLAMPLKVTFAV